MGVAQVFVGKVFVHRLQTTKSTKILPLENYPLYGRLCIAMVGQVFKGTTLPRVLLHWYLVFRSRLCSTTLLVLFSSVKIEQEEIKERMKGEL